MLSLPQSTFDKKNVRLLPVLVLCIVVVLSGSSFAGEPENDRTGAEKVENKTPEAKNTENKHEETTDNEKETTKESYTAEDLSFIAEIEAAAAAGAGAGGGGKDGHDDHSRLSDKPIPLQLENFPYSTPPLFSWPARFLGNGNLLKGIKLPTGAVWQPYFVIFGNYRTAAQFNDPGAGDGLGEWANGLNLFGNLYLTFTERILVGVQPLQEAGEFTGYNFAPDDDTQGFQDRANFRVTNLFFEGDFGELFPFLDKDDTWHWDLGVSVGRQLISFQGGMLVNDIMDAAGVTTINLKPPTAVNTRITLLYAWNELNRTYAGADLIEANSGLLGLLNDSNNLPMASDSLLPLVRSQVNQRDEDAMLFAFLTETDWRSSTVAMDAIYVKGNEFTGDGLHLGFDATQRMGYFSTNFRVVGSLPIGDETPFNQSGAVGFFEISKTPFGTYNHLYLNGYYGYKNFRSAARAPAFGGPLGGTGILFAAVGLGRYGAALSNSADESFGSALGYQMFFAKTRQQLIIEAGQRFGLDDGFGQRAFALGARFQSAIGTRLVAVIDGFGAYELGREATINNVMLSTDNQFRFGGRLEFLLKL